MAHVSLTANRGAPSGKCEYGTRSIFSHTKHWYNQDKWQYAIDRIVFICTAWREILSVGAYLPPSNWLLVPNINTPIPIPETGFVIDEPFENITRMGQEVQEYSSEWSPSQRIVRVRLGLDSNGESVFVSPHENLLLGAATAKDMVLSEILFLNVEGLPIAEKATNRS